MHLSTMSKHHSIAPFYGQQNSKSSRSKPLVFRDEQTRGRWLKHDTKRKNKHERINDVLQNVIQRHEQQILDLPEGQAFIRGKTGSMGVSHKKQNVTMVYGHEHQKFTPHVQQFKALRAGGMTSHSNSIHSQEAITSIARQEKGVPTHPASRRGASTTYSSFFGNAERRVSVQKSGPQHSKPQVFTYNVSGEPVIQYFCGPGISNEKMDLTTENNIIRHLDSSGLRRLSIVAAVRSQEPSRSIVPNMYSSSTHRAFRDTLALAQR